MMLRHVKTGIAFALATAGLVSWTAQAERLSESPPTALLKANDALLSRDYDGFLSEIQSVLADESADDFVQKNAQAMLEAAFKDGKGRIPAAIELPAGIGEFEIAQRRLEH